jgi:hypothetical protein
MVGALVVGIGLSFVRKPQYPYFRFAAGCAAIPVGFILTTYFFRVVVIHT